MKRPSKLQHDDHAATVDSRSESAWRTAPLGLEPNSKRPRILFATIAAGGSHVSTATAMIEALERYLPDSYRLELSEIMPEYGFVELDRRHKEGWRRALARPRVIVWGQYLLDSFPRQSVAFHRRLLADFAAEAAKRLNRERPALVVVNHGWLTVALTLAQRRYGLEVPVLTFETSTLNANALWADPGAEQFVVGSEISRRRLRNFGIPEERIDVVGYPVRQAFLQAPDKQTARNELGLDDDFTVLVTLGGEGVGGGPELVLEAIEGLDPKVQTIYVTGRNERLRRQLEPWRHRLPRLHLEGFVEQMSRMLAAADVVVGKTGPATVYEALAVGRPIIAPRKFGLAENKLLRVLERKQLGLYAPTAAAVAEGLRSYREEPARLEQVAQAAQAADFPGMAERLARYIDHYARHRRGDKSVCGRGLDLEG